MTTIEFVLERKIRAPIEEVFERLVDIDGYDAWMSGSGSMLKGTRKTSPGEPAVGTTYLDDTKSGKLHGEIVELDRPRRVVFHWWDTQLKGQSRYEGWPAYTLEPTADGSTHVRHDAKLVTYGLWSLVTPVFRRYAVRERTATLDALAASFLRG